MMLKYFSILVLVFIAVERISCQDVEEAPSEAGLEAQTLIDDGSGEGALENSITSTTESVPLEDVGEGLLEVAPSSIIVDESCPSSCECTENGEDFVVNCTGLQLTEFPSPLYPRTTELYLSDNHLVEIPTEIESLTRLKILDADNNFLLDLTPNTISKLSELQVLKLKDNKILEYPNELKNSISLTQLQELDLGGNDIRSDIKSEDLSNLIALRVLTLPISNEEQIMNLCAGLKNTLKTVCTESCSMQSFACVGASEYTDEELLTAVNPGTIALDKDLIDEELVNKTEVPNEPQLTTTTESPEITTVNENIVSSSGAIASRSGILKEMVDTEPQKLDTIVEAPANEQTKSDVKIGATTTAGPNKGGVDKSVIGFIVAGMVVVVAGITIQKNWSSIRKRFSSSSRTPERAGSNVNGTAPSEEVPLQEKSPV